MGDPIAILRERYPQPDTMSDDEWETGLREMADGRQLTGVRPYVMAWAHDPAIGRTVHTIKAEVPSMGEFGIVNLEKRFGMTTTGAEAASARFTAIAEAALEVAKAIADKGGKGDLETIPDDLAETAKSIGFAMMEAATGQLEAVKAADAEGDEGDMVKEIVKRLGATVELALTARRVIQETKAVKGDFSAAIKAASDVLATIKADFGEEDEEGDEDAEGTEGTTTKANLAKAESLIAQLNAERIEIAKMQLDKLSAGAGTMTKDEVRNTISAINSNLWKLEDDMAVIAKSLGIEYQAHNEAAVTKALGAVTKRVVVLEKTSKENDEKSNLLLGTLNAAMGIE